jgi:polyisoprenyl-phosphate glycosyltransferase
LSLEVKILIPVKNEQDGLQNFFLELKKEVSKLKSYNFSYLFVDDGSDDHSLQVISDLKVKNERIDYISLSRNFGKETAISAGFDFLDNTVDAVICIDSDFQHPVRFIPKLLETWVAEDVNLVMAVRSSLEDQSIMKNLGRKTFYYFMNIIGSKDFIANLTDFGLYDRKIIDAYRKLNETERVFKDLIRWIGFKRSQISFTAPKRSIGVSSFSITQLFNTAFDTLVSNTTKPLRAILFVGVVTIIITTIMLLFIAINIMFSSNLGLSYQTFIIVFNTFLAGVQLSALGLASIYLANISKETKKRPLYLVSATSFTTNVGNKIDTK